MDTPIEEGHRSERLWSLIETHARQLGRHVVPIYRDDKRGRPRLHGSGLLLATSNSSFLVTAAHVLDPLRVDKNLYLHLRKRKLHLAGKYLLTNPPHGEIRDDDQLDLGILRLDGPAAPPYLEIEKVPLPIEALMPGAIPRQRKQYCVLGFPGSQGKVDLGRREVVARAYTNLCRSSPPEKYEELGLPTSRNIVLEFNRTRVLDRKGQRQTFPQPAGMSGSPVWLLWDAEGQNDVKQTPVVGILIEHRQDQQVLVAADAMFVVEMIRSGF
jgi:hypothetical protein